MIIATTYENGNICQHFGHTEAFKFYKIENNEIIESQIIEPKGFAHGTLPTFIKNNGAGILICGGLGGGARELIAEAGIQLYPGAAGDSDAVVQAFLTKTLNYDPDFSCSGHDHGDESHQCN